ncbi:MAG: hypothetical protein K1X88_30670 [Nannocystaceae bacterium]|nr:hypothetical protein [Nannocystaceae bacterium]
MPSGCNDANDCVAYEDCCNCLALPVGVEPPPCDLPECFATACGAIGINPVAQCELDSCELVPLPCNPYDVTCDSTPPDCPVGSAPSVDPNDSCWTGLCVPAELCDVVPSCADCPDDEVCISNVAQLPTQQCSPIPQACEGTPTCACMGEVCVAPFDTCSDGDGTITCSCVTC